MNNSFSELGISPPILKAIEEMGFEEPTEVQRRAIPHILNKEDLIVMSKTGSGKTAVFGVSVLQLTDPDVPGPQGLILTPTRELAVQVDGDIRQLASHLKHKTTVLYGQHSMNIEIQSLKKGATIVTGTPGRVYDHIQHGNLVTKNIRFLVLDEADRMLDMGFLDQVERIVKTVPKDRVTLLFSATIPPEIKRICSRHMNNTEMIEIESPTLTVDTIQQVYYRVNHNEKNTQLNRLLLYEQPESCLIFCNTRMAADRVQSFLTRKGYASHALHGDIPQGRRMKTIEQFKHGEFHILVATDVAARGLQIDNLSLVINYDVPVEKDSYVHRIGRTGRAGNSGRSITLVTGDDIMSLYEIEEHIGTMIEEGVLPSDAEVNERKAQADKWLEVNAVREIPSDTANKVTANRRHKSRGRQEANRPRAATQRRQSTAEEARQDKQKSRYGKLPAEGQTQPVSNRSNIPLADKRRSAADRTVSGRTDASVRSERPAAQTFGPVSASTRPAAHKTAQSAKQSQADGYLSQRRQEAGQNLPSRSTQDASRKQPNWQSFDQLQLNSPKKSLFQRVFGRFLGK